MNNNAIVCALLCLATCFVVTCSKDHVDISKIEKLAESLTNDSLGVAIIQERVNLLNYSKTRFDGKTIVKKLCKTIAEKIYMHIEALRKTKNLLEASLKKSIRAKSWPSCCRYSEKHLMFDLSFKTKVDDSNGCEVISDSSPRYVTSIPTEVLGVMKENRRNIPSLKWQYVGSEEGVFTMYPAVDNPDMCGGMNYDPRIRPWYVETASPKSKHVLILLDSSFSMAQTHAGIELIEIAKKAVIKVMGTLNPKDRLGIVAFNDTAYIPENCYGHSLAVATPVNIAALKSEFLTRLKPGGQSNYAEGFRAAFNLLESTWNTSKNMKQFRPSPTDNNSFDCILLFITDGEASEVKRNHLDAVYRAIREGNEKVRNNIRIYAYGVGRKVNIDLLNNIVSQNFSGVLPDLNYTEEDRRPVPGYAYKIEDASLLRNNMSFLYHNYRPENMSEPSFSMPYFDAAGLGLIFTAGFPLHIEHEDRNSFFGVVAIDIALDDLLENAIQFKKDARSYVFVMDDTGRVLTHPLMPHPKYHVNAPAFIQIDALERDAEFLPVMESMMKGEEGTMSFSSQRIAPSGDCNWVFNVNQTYFWKPIKGTKFSVCFVEETTDYSAKLTPDIAAVCNFLTHKDYFGGSVIHENQKFLYHRLDLIENSEVCRHFYQISTVAHSTVKFTASCFKNPVQYSTLPETKSNVSDVNRFFNKLIKCTNLDQAQKVLQEEARIQDLFVPDVISDVLWTSFAESFWFTANKFLKHIIRRFIATPSGMMRLFPGTNLTQNYDPTKRFWYELALTREGMVAFSPPYKDAAGAGNVVTLSHTIYAMRKSPNESFEENKIIAVVGLDLSLDFLYHQLVEMYPKCKSVWKCQLVNLRGYVVLHPNYLKVDAAKEKQHITGDDSELSLLLLKRGDMFRAACLDLDSNDYKVSYVIKPETYLDTLNSTDICGRYYMKKIKNTNLFFVAQEYHNHCFTTACRFDNKPCWNHHLCVIKEIIPDVCECPCTTPLVVDKCINYIMLMRLKVKLSDNRTADLNIPPCFPDRPKSDTVESKCVSSQLKRCVDPGCSEIHNKQQCAGVVGCTWCWHQTNGTVIANPFCADSDVCYNGIMNNTLPGYMNVQASCDIENRGSLVLSIVFAIVGFFILLVIACILVALWYFKGNKELKDIIKQKKKQKDEVAALSAALGMRSSKSFRKQSLGSISQQMQSANRLASISSQISGQVKPSPSHQVVLSIVDSSGSEIARSQPRPVQIIHGNRPGRTSATIGAPKTSGESCLNSANSNALSITSRNSFGSVRRNPLSVSAQNISHFANRSRSRPCSRPISPAPMLGRPSKSAPSSPRRLRRPIPRPQSLSTGLATAIESLGINKHNGYVSPNYMQASASMSNVNECQMTPNEVDSAYSDESVRPRSQSPGEQFSDYVAVGVDGSITPAGPSMPGSPVHFKFDRHVNQWDSFDRIEARSPSNDIEEDNESDHHHSPSLLDLPQYDDFSLTYMKSNMSALLSELDSASSLDSQNDVRNRKNNKIDDYAKVRKKNVPTKDNDSSDDGIAIYV